jgi:hypothetical protein
MATSRTRSGAQHRSTGEFFVVAIFHHRDERLRDGLVGSGPVGLLSHLHQLTIRGITDIAFAADLRRRGAHCLRIDREGFVFVAERDFCKGDGR